MLIEVSYIISKVVVGCGVNSTITAVGDFVKERVVKKYKRRRRIGKKNDTKN